MGDLGLPLIEIETPGGRGAGGEATQAGSETPVDKHLGAAEHVACSSGDESEQGTRDQELWE